MRIETKTIYITDDGREFENQYDAETHEQELLINNVLEGDYICIGEYEIRELNSKKELDVLLNQDYGEHSNYIPDNVTYPIKVAIKMDDSCFYFTYELLEDAIKREQHYCDLMKKEL